MGTYLALLAGRAPFTFEDTNIMKFPAGTNIDVTLDNIDLILYQEQVMT